MIETRAPDGGYLLPDMGETVDDDAALVQRCLSGDPDAIRTFVERFQRLIFGVCCRVLGNRHDAEDVTQETLLRAVRHLKHWDAGRALRPWLLTIAVNRCRTSLQRRARRPVAVEDPSWPATGRTTPDLGEELQRAVNELRPDYRTCFVLFYEQELSIEEISAIMDCPKGTIKTWLHRARKELAGRLRDRGLVDEEGYELHKF